MRRLGLFCAVGLSLERDCEGNIAEKYVLWADNLHPPGGNLPEYDCNVFDEKRDRLQIILYNRYIRYLLYGRCFMLKKIDRTFSREELYNEIWTISLSKTAAKIQYTREQASFCMYRV